MSKKVIKLLYDQVLIEIIEEESSASILVPDSAKKKSTEGKVIAVGVGIKNSDGKYDALTVKVGDIVMFRKWAGTEMKFNDKDCVVLKETEIIGILSQGGNNG